MPKYLLFFFLMLGVHVAVAQGPVSTIDSVHPSCNGVCDGYARVKIVGGTPPYSIIWNTTPVQSTLEAVNVCPGNYQVIILDSLNRSAISNVTIAFDTVRATVTHTNLSCSNYGVDTVTVLATSAFGPFSYTWNNGPVTIVPTITNLPVGANIVTAFDTLGCSTTDTFIIQQPTEIRFRDTVQNALCYDSSSGTITIAVTGGTAPYSYLWDNDTAQTTNIRTHAAAGLHVVVVTDSSGCIEADTVAVGQPTPISISSLQVMNPLCYNVGDGIIYATAAGGTPMYTYSWNTTPPQTGALIKYLYAGTYILTVTDSNSCTMTDTVTLTQPTALTDSTTKTDILCNGARNGRGMVYPTGGTAPYRVGWANPVVAGSLDTLLSPGVNLVTILDVNGCIIIDTVRIAQPPALTIALTKTPDTGHCSGTATALVTGGTGAYTYLWSTGATTTAITNLCAGKYGFQVTDSNHCIATDSTQVQLQYRTGISNIAQATINIAPNPFSAYFVLDWGNTTYQPTQIRVTNTTGATVYSSAIDGNKNYKTTIPTTNWVPGFYFIHVADANGIIGWKKVVKE